MSEITVSQAHRHLKDQFPNWKYISSCFPVPETSCPPYSHPISVAAALKASESFVFELPASALPRYYELKADSIRAKKSASLAKSFRSPHFLTISPISTDFLCECTSFQAHRAQCRYLTCCSKGFDRFSRCCC